VIHRGGIADDADAFAVELGGSQKTFGSELYDHDADYSTP
jgi:hypothetical protein